VTQVPQRVCSDSGNAERLIDAYGQDFRYCPQWGRWLHWDGTRWLIDETGAIWRAAKHTVREILEEARQADDSTRPRLVKWQLVSESEPALRRMINLAEREPQVVVTPGQLDSSHWLLNVENGTVNLEIGSLGSHFDEDLITKLTPVRFHGEQARCDRWLEFLDRISDGDGELMSFVQQAVGYSLTGDTSEQCLFILYGTGANGKSTFLEVIRSLLGEYATAADFSTFLVQRNDSIRNDLARLAGARFVTAVEAERGGRLSESVVKQLTGGDTITARFLYREYFDFKPTHKIWLAANHKPTIRGTDNAIWRRIRLIPFTVTIPTEQQDRHLAEKLGQELPGILQWAIEGCVAWREAGRLEAPETVRNATAEYQVEMDFLAPFLEERCLMSPNGRVKAKELYESYSEWAKQSGEYVLSQTKLGRMLVERGFQKGRGGPDKATEYHGLSLRQPVQAEWQ
jgi:putative DNA primase/helicase